MSRGESVAASVARVAAQAIVEIREATEADVPRILAIDNAAFPAYPETPARQIVGYSNFRHMPGQFDPARYRVVVCTDPEWQRRGVGSALMAQMLEAIAARGGQAIETYARETVPEVVAFLEHRGFREIMRVWENRLDVARFDPAPFARHLDRVRQAGVEITTLAEERRRAPDALRHAHELHDAIEADIPAPIPFTPPSFEQFVLSSVESPRALQDAYFLARIGETYVGEANLQKPAEGTRLYHDTTGVLSAYRGRGIAMAPKLATFAYARARGSSEIWTWNEVKNTSMLVINERLGFVRQPAWITFERSLGLARSA